MTTLPTAPNMNNQNGAIAPVIRVVVADEHPIVCVGITQELSRQPDMTVVGEATNGDDLAKRVRRLTPDIVLLDIKLPGLDPIAALQQLADLPHPPHILIFTAHAELDCVLAALKCGVTGYVLKNEPPAILALSVRAVAQGETWMSPAVVQQLISYTTRDQTDADEPMLSPREQEVLHLLAEGKENQTIGDILCISERTVRYHLRNIYSKIGVQRRGEAIVWSIRKGFNEAHS